MKVLDSIQHKLHKLLLVEDNGEFSVLGQAINRRAITVVLAKRRIATIH